MKRLVTLMLVVGLAMLPLSLAGCGQAADSAPAASSDDSATPDTPSADQEEDSSSDTTSEGSGY